MEWTIGQNIWIRCTAKPGTFSDERLIIIDSTVGPVSGFVSETEMKRGTNGVAFVRGVIRNIARDTLEAWINGSFFNTNGLTKVSPENATAA